MALQTTLQSLQNKLSDTFTQSVNWALGHKTLESNRYRYEMITPLSYSIGKEWLEATPTLADPSSYTISKIRTKNMNAIFAAHSNGVINQKITDESGQPKLFSLSGVLVELDKFHKEIAENIAIKDQYNSVNYRLCK